MTGNNFVDISIQCLFQTGQDRNKPEPTKPWLRACRLIGAPNHEWGASATVNRDVKKLSCPGEGWDGGGMNDL
jgi:hypothetical protein